MTIHIYRVHPPRSKKMIYVYVWRLVLSFYLASNLIFSLLFKGARYPPPLKFRVNLLNIAYFFFVRTFSSVFLPIILSIVIYRTLLKLYAFEVHPCSSGMVVYMSIMKYIYVYFNASFVYPG